jgi:dTDP-4-amino-4,6-dideoxygalactose transaminase
MSTFNNLGFNLRLSDIQSAVGIAQMQKLDNLLEERRRLALRYTALLAGTRRVICPHDDEGHTYQSYVIRVDGGRTERNRVMDCLAAAGVQTRPGTHAVHRLGYYANKYSLKAELFPNAAAAEDTSITLPIFPGMTHAEQGRVVDLLTAALKP